MKRKMYQENNLSLEYQCVSLSKPTTVLGGDKGQAGRAKNGNEWDKELIFMWVALDQNICGVELAICCPVQFSLPLATALKQRRKVIAESV